jgi:hypothetical protein
MAIVSGISNPQPVPAGFLENNQFKQTKHKGKNTMRFASINPYPANVENRVSS